FLKLAEQQRRSKKGNKIRINNYLRTFTCRRINNKNKSDDKRNK
ncbi:hypothetical protein DOY81_006158, partial [Sarcophaga bullata]